MYQVLLADDEQSILDSMAHHFPWEKYGTKVAYTASTGKQAYDILVTTPLISPFSISGCRATAVWS